MYKHDNMKNFKTLLNIAFIATTLLFISCNNDDDEVINVQDLVVDINENPTNGQVIGSVEANGNGVFSIASQTPNGALNIDASTGELTVADATLFDYETNPIITATVEVVGAVNEGSVTININNINELSAQDLDVTIDENPSSGQSVGAVQSDGDGTISFSITSQTPSGALNIDASTGELTVADATLFDFETNPVITANISVNNSVNTATAIATINLNNINELSAQDLDLTIDENPTNGQSVGTVQAAGDGTLSFSITSQTPSGALNINASTGELTVADATLFDFETNPVITANISVDNSVNTVTVIATINLNDVAEAATIGDFRDGGVVFWVDPTDNTHGLVVAVSNQSFGAKWGCQGTSVSGTSSSIGSGAANTVAIETACTTAGTAADLAANLSLNGYDDWFLPSKDELLEFYLNKDIVNATAIANGGSVPNQFHWSSTEHSTSADHAVLVNLTTGVWANATKNFNYGVRAVRAF